MSSKTIPRCVVAFGAVLPLGVSLIWKGAGDILDRRYLVLFVVRVAVAGALAGALVSP